MEGQYLSVKHFLILLCKKVTLTILKKTYICTLQNIKTPYKKVFVRCDEWSGSISIQQL